uniref:Signal transducer and activator of transcription n=1 Tax=Oryzias latipes TaxID=8090 RepID=A0A3P9INA9_ORYLA
MAQWESLLKLPASYRLQLDDLYDRDFLPMDVRHHLSAWIEKQDWQRATQDHALASVLLQVLLENLDIQHSRFVQEELFLQQHNIRRYKHKFQMHQDDPCKLASTIHWYLEKEKEILKDVTLDEQVQRLTVTQETMEISCQQDLECKMSSLKNEVQCMEHAVICLEEQQDEFDFKYQTHMLEATADEALKKEQFKTLQMLINKLNECRKSILMDMNKLLDRVEGLIHRLVDKELIDWKRRQQKSCIGAPDNVCLDQMEKWFTGVAVCLFQMLEFLKKLDELVGKMTYPNDPVKAQKPALQTRTNSLLQTLLKSSFVVETQPSMPQGKGPLVLRTNVQFSAKTRILVKFPELNHSMTVAVCMDRYRRFNVLGTRTKALNMAESHSGGMVADFRHLTLREQKSGSGGKGVSDISLSVTEELHLIYFDTLFELKGFSVQLQTCSLPVVIISNSSQQQSAWASILWCNMLSQDHKDVMFFANTPAAPWPQFAEMLSWQFLSATKRGLDGAQLEMIAHRLFGKQENYDTCNVTWSKFSKGNTPESFWVWLDGILVMVKMYLEDLWREGLIMGFVNKSKEKSLLKRKQRGTFLLRFSESVIGGITFSWVEINFTVQPFTKVDLSQIPFHEIIRNFQILEAENVPENPLLYLYPNIPKDDAFGKFYTEKTGDDSPYIKYIKTKLVFPLESTLETYSPDPMLSSSAEPQTDELLQYLNNPNNFSADFLPSDSPLPDLNLSSFISTPIQACGGIYL